MEHMKINKGYEKYWQNKMQGIDNLTMKNKYLHFINKELIVIKKNGSDRGLENNPVLIHTCDLYYKKYKEYGLLIFTALSIFPNDIKKEILQYIKYNYKKYYDAIGINGYCKTFTHMFNRVYSMRFKLYYKGKYVYYVKDPIKEKREKKEDELRKKFCEKNTFTIPANTESLDITFEINGSTYTHHYRNLMDLVFSPFV